MGWFGELFCSCHCMLLICLTVSCFWCLSPSLLALTAFWLVSNRFDSLVCIINHAPKVYKYPDFDEIAKFYDPETNNKISGTTPQSVIDNRVHSKGYHDYRNYVTKTLQQKITEDVNTTAGEIGIKCVAAWHRLFVRRELAFSEKSSVGSTF